MCYFRLIGCSEGIEIDACAKDANYNGEKVELERARCFHWDKRYLQVCSQFLRYVDHTWDFVQLLV